MRCLHSPWSCFFFFSVSYALHPNVSTAMTIITIINIRTRGGVLLNCNISRTGMKVQGTRYLVLGISYEYGFRFKKVTEQCVLCGACERESIKSFASLDQTRLRSRLFARHSLLFSLTGWM